MLGELVETKTLKAGNNQVDLGDKSNILFITIHENGEIIRTEKIMRI